LVVLDVYFKDENPMGRLKSGGDFWGTHQ